MYYDIFYLLVKLQLKWDTSKKDKLCKYLPYTLYSPQWCVFQISKRHQQTPLLTPFLKNSDKFRKLYFLALLGEIGGNIPKMALLLGVWEIFFLKFCPKNYFFQAKTGFCNFYTNIYEYLKPDLKNLITGLSESVEKYTKSWKL